MQASPSTVVGILETCEGPYTVQIDESDTDDTHWCVWSKHNRYLDAVNIALDTIKRHGPLRVVTKTGAVLWHHP